jgi:SAM-dependent methyltransferase
MSRPTEASTAPRPHAVGKQTLDVFADTPRINAWMYSKFSAHVGGTVLEVGSGVGNMSRLLVRDAERIVLTDIEDSYLACLREAFANDRRVEVTRFELGTDPPPSVSKHRYDAILAINVIEHVQDDLGALRTLASLLKPGGHLLVYVPACSFAFGTLDQELAHFRRYSARGLADVLTRAGLLAGPVRYMNFPGLLGWIWNGRVRRARALDRSNVLAFENIVGWIARFEKLVPPAIGLGVTCCARKPA